MKPERNNRVVALLCLLMLGAGVASGLLANRLRWLNQSVSGASEGNTVADNGTLIAQLHLTPDQRDHMRAIWETARDDIHDCYHDADSLQKQRDQAIAAILTERQKAEFETIAADFASRFTQLNQKRDQSIQSAVDQTNRLLNQQQRTKYEQMIRSRLSRNVNATLGAASPTASDLSLRVP